MRRTAAAVGVEQQTRIQRELEHELMAPLDRASRHSQSHSRSSGHGRDLVLDLSDAGSAAPNDSSNTTASVAKPNVCEYFQVLTPTAGASYCPSDLLARNDDNTNSNDSAAVDLGGGESKFWIPSQSSFSSHSHRDVSDGSVTNGSRHSTRSDACDSTRSWGIRDGDGDGVHGPTCRVRGRPRTGALPSSHYYIDAHGRLRVRRMWRFYTRLRRLLWVLLPWFKHDDSNTFLCSAMISNSALIVAIFVIRLAINRFVLSIFLTQDDGVASRCHEFSQEFLELFSYSLIGNVLLCLPAFNLPMCKLFRKKKVKRAATATTATTTTAIASAAVTLTRTSALAPAFAAAQPKVLSLASTSNGTAAASGIAVDDDEPQYEKTYLFSVLELLVIFEIPYLIVTFVMLVYPSSDGLFTLTAHCYTDLAPGYFVAFVIAQIIGLFTYSLRWNQIVIFHRLHEHFLFQRGCLPGRARFDYVESSFRVSFFASRAKKRRHAIQKELYRAAKSGDVDRVRALVDEAIVIDGPEFSTKWYGDRNGGAWMLGQSLIVAKCHRNPLHVAVVFDQAEVVEELLGNGHFDVHQLEKMELLKLNISWLYRFLFEIVSFLKRSHFSIDRTRRVFGPVGVFRSTLLTPLHVAVSMGNTDMVLLLLRYGADPNLPALSSHRKYATPALFWVMNKECTRLLLDADANPLYVPGKGIYLTPFEVARLTGNVAVARQMEKYGGDMALTPLHDAASKGFKSEVRFYLEHGADPNCLGEKVTGYFRRTPLHWAAMRGETGAMKLLLRYGAEVDAKDVFGRTPLVWACVLNRVKAVELLLTNGANCNVRDVQGDPILCICAAGACTTMSTATATAGGSAVRSGGNYDRNGDGGGGDREAEHEHHHHSSLARSMDPQVFALLKSHGVDVHATRQCNGDSALHVALRKNNESAAVLFVRAGISLTAANYLGQRAMDCATSSSLRYAIKKEAGHRDVMISYCHSHAALARKLRDALEQAHVTTWIDSMDPSGITGGSIWRQEIAAGIQSSALVLAMLTADYPASQWCMKELAFAKMQNVPVVAIQCEDMEITEELQVYLWTRQIVDFRAAVKHSTNTHAQSSASLKRSSHAGGDNDEYALADGDAALGPGATIDDVTTVDEVGDKFAHEYDDDKFRNCMRLLLDGIQDQIEEHRVRMEQWQSRRKLLKRSKAIVNEDDSHGEGGGDGDDDGSEDELTKRRDGVTKRGRPALREDDFAAGSSALDVLASGSPALGALAASTSSSSYVFIANGDYHKSFCQRLKTTLAKQGVRCVVDQAVPAVQYSYRSKAAGAQRAARASHHSNNSTSSSAAAVAHHDVASMSVQARQMAAKDAILGCAAVIVVISPLSAKCDVLADQLAFAEDRGKLIVPLLLSLHSLDLAKRYTFSRCVIQHFNASIGFEQSAETLVTYLRTQTQSCERQRRRQQWRARLAAADGRSGGGGGGGEDAVSDGFYSPASSTRSSLTHFVTGVGSGEPADTMPLSSTISLGELLPPVSIATQRRQPGAVTSGHGWSALNVSPSVAEDDALQYQQQHLHHERRSSNNSIASTRVGRDSNRLSRLYSNGSTRTTEYLG